MIRFTKKIAYCFVKMRIDQGKYCRDAIANTTQLISKTAAITLGPAGRNVLIEMEKKEPRITKDGVTVEDRLADAISTLVKKSVDNTNRFAGDGTTTSTIIIAEIIKQANISIQKGTSIREIKAGINVGKDIALEFIESVCRKIETKEELKKVALVATNGNEEIASILSETVFECKNIKIEKSHRNSTYVEYYSGLRIDRGIPHPDFKNAGDKMIYNYPLTLISAQPLMQIEDIVKALEIAQKARKQLLIFAPNISDSILSTLIYNQRKSILEACAIKFPAYGTEYLQLLKHIAIHTGSHYFEEIGISIRDIEFHHFGKAISVEADDFSMEIEGKYSAGNMNATIFSGGRTEAEILENQDKVIDALSSVRGAKEKGIVAGGGVTFWKIADLLDVYHGEHKEGVKALAAALRLPRRELLRTVEISEKSLNGTGWEGYVFKTGKVEDMFEAGIVDSVTVAKNVIIDCASLSQMLIDVDVTVTRIEKNDKFINYDAMKEQFKL